MKCRINRRAQRELVEIYEYIGRHDPLAAEAVMMRLDQALLNLGDQPGIGHATNHAGMRGFPLVQYPYIIFYRVHAKRNEVEILRIRHAARRHPGFQDAAVEIFAR